jgi:hypothetical protein
MIEIPVMLGFDKEKVIGSLKINVEELPKTPEYVFSLGYRLLDAEGGHQLFGVSLLTDQEYKKYLKWDEAGRPA